MLNMKNLFGSKKPDTQATSAISTYAPQILQQLILTAEEIETSIRVMNDLSGNVLGAPVLPEYISKERAKNVAQRYWNIIEKRLAVTEDLLGIQYTLEMSPIVPVKDENQLELDFAEAKTIKHPATIKAEAEIVNAENTVIENAADTTDSNTFFVLDHADLEKSLFNSLKVKNDLLDSAGLKEFESKIRKFKSGLVSDESGLSMLKEWYIDVIVSGRINGCDSLKDKVDSIKARYEGLVEHQVKHKTVADQNKEKNAGIPTFKELTAQARELFATDMLKGIELLSVALSTGNVLCSKTYALKQPFKESRILSHSRNEIASYLKSINQPVDTNEHIISIEARKRELMEAKVVATPVAETTNVTVDTASEKALITHAEYEAKAKELAHSPAAFIAYAKTIRYKYINKDKVEEICEPAISSTDNQIESFQNYILKNQSTILANVKTDLGNVVEATPVVKLETSNEQSSTSTTNVVTTESTEKDSTVKTDVPFEMSDEDVEVSIKTIMLKYLHDNAGTISGEIFKKIVDDVCAPLNITLNKKTRTKIFQSTKLSFKVEKENLALQSAVTNNCASPITIDKTEEEDKVDRTIVLDAQTDITSEVVKTDVETIEVNSNIEEAVVFERKSFKPEYPEIYTKLDAINASKEESVLDAAKLILVEAKLNTNWNVSANMILDLYASNKVLVKQKRNEDSIMAIYDKIFIANLDAQEESTTIASIQTEEEVLSLCREILLTDFSKKKECFELVKVWNLSSNKLNGTDKEIWKFINKFMATDEQLKAAKAELKIAA